LPSANIHDSDPYIPDYEAAHIPSPSKVDLESCPETQVLTQLPVEENNQQSDERTREASTDAAQRLEALFQPASEVKTTPSSKSSVASLLEHAQPEDPIKALDALQEAIDEVEGSLPILRALPETRSPTTRLSPPKMKSSSPKTSALLSLKQKKQTNVLKDTSSATFSPKVQQTKKRSAIAALNTPPKASKSTKPVTKSDFQLPGEVIAAKLKAQREERLKREQEEEKKRKEFKARPVMKPMKSYEVKDTLKSKARMSMMSSSINVAQKSSEAGDTSSRPAVRPSMPTSRSSSTLRLTTQGPRPVANTSSLRSKPATVIMTQVRKPAISAATMGRSIAREQHQSTSRSSLSSSRKSDATALIATEPQPRQKATGAEVFKRPMLQKAMEERALKERIEAQKKAKADAAERSRQLSREFAAKKAGSKSGSRNVSASTESPVTESFREVPAGASRGEEVKTGIEV
jgi:hypothetical protein